MLQSFTVVGTQVFILFILIGIGFVGTKAGIIKKEGVSTITEIMLYIVTPCVIIHAFQRDFEPSLLKGFLIAFGAAILSHVICIILGKLFIQNEDDDKKRLFRFGVIFSNCGFMSLPLLDALLGSEGVFYGASYVAVFNLFLWSYGLVLMDTKGGALSVKKILLNPGVIPVVIGLIFFFTSFRLPNIIGIPVEYLAALNTPVPMLVIGYNVSRLDLKKAMRDRDEYIGRCQLYHVHHQIWRQQRAVCGDCRGFDSFIYNNYDSHCRVCFCYSMTCVIIQKSFRGDYVRV